MGCEPPVLVSRKLNYKIIEPPRQNIIIIYIKCTSQICGHPCRVCTFTLNVTNSHNFRQFVALKHDLLTDITHLYHHKMLCFKCGTYRLNVRNT